MSVVEKWSKDPDWAYYPPCQSFCVNSRTPVIERLKSFYERTDLFKSIFNQVLDTSGL